MKNLHFKDNFKNFLYDLNNFITIYDNHLHIFNYLKLNKLSECEIVIVLDKYEVNIKGNNLNIKQMTKQELLITGIILEIKFNYV